MTEVEKMRNGLLADMSSPELQVRFEHAKKLLARMRGMSTYASMCLSMLTAHFWTADISRLVLIRLSGLVCRFTHRIIRWIIWKEEAPRNTLIRWRLVRTAGLVAELLYVPV